MSPLPRVSLRFPLFGQRLPLRFLARRVLQAMAERSVANYILGERSAPGRFFVARLVQSEDERAGCLQIFGESRQAIEAEVARDAAARGIRPRQEVNVDLAAFTPADLESGAARAWLESRRVGTGGEPVEPLLEQLRGRGEAILAARTYLLEVESEPAGAAVYLDGRPLRRVTPCRITDALPGDRRLTLALPGYRTREETVTIAPGAPGATRLRATLEPLPELAVVAVRTYPSRARVTIGEESRPAPAHFRLAPGRHALTAEREGYAPAELEFDVPAGGEAPEIALRLEYRGPEAEQQVGRLVIYRPEESPAQPERPAAEFGQEPAAGDGEVLGERPLRRGVLLIGQPEEGGPPLDVRLFDPEGRVAHGCHAWLEITAPPGGGAPEILLHSEAPAGVRVDGQPAGATAKLDDGALLQIGGFRLRVVKETAAARIEF